MSGHSHWSKIKRAKGANDATRGKVWSKIARKIIIAAKNGGDPKDNLSLRYVIEEAKAANMPKDTIEKAIAKGAGGQDAESFEAALYEGYAPGGVALMVDVLTNNRSRTAPEIRKIFESAGGRLATSGSVSFQFVKQGLISVKAQEISEDRLMELALEAGADDVINEGEFFEVVTAPTALHKVKEALAAAKVPIENAEAAYVPNSTVTVDTATAQRVLRLIDAFQDNDDVQAVSHNAEIPDSVTV
jgi:YebC/PmpR family DNA-binding regulatory protein